MPTNDPPKTTEAWWDAQDAAKHLKFPVRTVRHLMQNRKIKASKVGSLWRTKESWVDGSMEKLTLETRRRP